MITINQQPQSLVLHLGSPATFTIVATHSNPMANLLYQWYKNDQLIQGATTNTLVFPAFNSTDQEVYSCVVSDDTDTDTVCSDYAALAASLLDYIELKIKIAILGMSKVKGYNWDWKTVNQPDEAIGDFPRAVILSPAEACIDEIAGQDAQSYSNDVLFVVMIKGSQEWSANANFTIRSNLRTALDDLKQLFGRDTSIGGSCEVVMYRSSQVIAANMNDIQRPSHMNTQWRVRYAQDRLTPLTVSSS
jgi:hypothetical protein